MTIHEAIFARLQVVAAVEALIGAGAGMRAYPGQAPQGAAAPYVVWQAVGGTPPRSHGEAAGPARIRAVQFICWAGTLAAAVAVREALIEALDNQTLGTGDIGQLEDGDREDFDSAVELYRADADFLF
jgi:hypothetical protein